jgi:hypothetical protein
VNIFVLGVYSKASYFVLIHKYYRVDQIKDNEVGRECGTHGRGEKSVQYKVLVVKLEAKRSLERPRGRWGDGIGMDLREIG